MYEDEKDRFKKIHGYEPDLKNPKSFNEKVVYKKLFDRNPLITLTADKYRVRQYVRDRLGWEADNHLVPLFHVTKNPYIIPLSLMPSQYVIKPNNGAGRWIIVENDKGRKKYTVDNLGVFYDLTQDEIANYCNDWFKTVHGTKWYEWAYQDINPLIVVEQLLSNSDGTLPNDYRLCMFGGKLKFLYVTSPYQATFNLYDEHFNPLPVSRKGHPEAPIEKKPFRFPSMVKYAETLSKGFDFIRVDFYLVSSWIYFGELTHYPGAGHSVFEPKEYDLELGKYWKVGSGTYDRYI